MSIHLDNPKGETWCGGLARGGSVLTHEHTTCLFCLRKLICQLQGEVHRLRERDTCLIPRGNLWQAYCGACGWTGPLRIWIVARGESRQHVCPKEVTP